MSRLFGTDGVRGVANVDLTSELALQIGRAAAMVLLKESKSAKPTVLIGKDTRASGDMLEAALTAGLCSVGCNVLSALSLLLQLLIWLINMAVRRAL